MMIQVASRACCFLAWFSGLEHSGGMIESEDRIPVFGDYFTSKNTPHSVTNKN